MSYDYANMLFIVLYHQPHGPRGAMSTRAMEKYWLCRVDNPDDWDRHAFRDALKRGYEEGKFLRVQRSYYLSDAVINGEMASRESDAEAEQEEEEVEFDPDELLAAYATWLTERGYRDVERIAMIETYAVALGLMYGYGDPADDEDDSNHADVDD